MDTPSNCLFITFVEKEGPFLKVWGQTDKNTSLYVEQLLNSFTQQFDNGLCIPHPETLQIGILCCAKYKDSKYYRSRITSLDYLHNRYIEVNFVDYGHRDIVPISNIRSLEGFDTAFISIPAQASSFLLAEAVCLRGEWNDVYLDQISKEIRYTEVSYGIIAQVTRHYLVRLLVGVNDLAAILISKGLMRHTSLTTQEAVLLAAMPRAAVLPQPQQGQQNIATYKAFTLEPGNQYEVYVSYVTDGPCNFSVQLKQSEEILAKLMKEINSMTLTPIEGIPLPGTVCLARCMEDAHICRAVVTNEVDGQYKVFYVDFGNFEVVSLDSLYEIPFKFVIPKVMAIRFALAGIDKSTVTLDMQCAFKQFVDNRLIHMKVMPMTTRTSLPRCELWDPETQISAFDIVNQAASAGYPEHISLTRGFSQPVKVSYVFSCNRFYVQLKSREEELAKLMVDIQLFCRDTPALAGDMLKSGMPCYALYEGDQQWYRSQIADVLEHGQTRVQYVDYGNEEIVLFSNLKPIEGRQLTVLRPQAIECCLNGYQNMELDQERDALLEELILEREFTMKVVEMQGKKALIELIDAANYNVASLLLDKIAVTRSQVSPMLVQAGNKIEHRKTPPNLGPREQRKPERCVESGNEPFSWRQDNKGIRAASFESNENNETTSWRQDNKSFNKNYDRNKRENDLNDSTDSDKHSQKGFGKNDRNQNFNNRNTEGGSWKQNNRDNRGFNKNQDRFNNKNEWNGGEERSNNRQNNDDWGGGGDNDWKNRNSGGDWAGSKENTGRNFNKRDQDDRGGRKAFSPKGKSEWGEERESRPFKKKEWENNEGKKESWGNKGRDSNFKPRNRSGEGGGESWNNEGGKDWNNETSQKGGFRKRQDDGGSEWNNDSGQKGGFKKRPDFKREASELSSSGSENSFRKGFKDNKQGNKPSFNKRFDKPRNFENDASGAGESWGATSAPALEVPNPAPSTAQFISENVENTEATVTISWFHNPTSFYCQLEDKQDQFKTLMDDIQKAYKGRRPSTAVVGAPVIGLFPEDKVLYRAKILETIGSKFKMYYVDFGNVSVVDKVWPIEQRFMDLPAQAIWCKLGGIGPVGDHWADATSYSAYFDSKQFSCKFAAIEEDKVAVQLECNNEDIASALIRDGLAQPALSVVPPELPLFVGQQFRAMLVQIESLANFSVALQSGVLLDCSVHNLQSSTETWEDHLKEKLGQILIVYVDDFKDDRLQVTMYDETGAKIKLIDNDTEAFETVELICPYLVTNSSLSGDVTHVEENMVFIQPTGCAETIEYLINTGYEHYENTPVEFPVTPAENYFYAVKGSDTNWYRGRVTKIEGEQITVNYFDYGNSEDVAVDAIRQLTAEFMEIQTLCLGVTIQDATEALIGQQILVNLALTENGLEGTIQEQQTQPETSELPTVEPQSDLEPQPELTLSPPIAESSEIIGTQVVLSHVDSPSDFYLQLAESLDSIDQLQATLQEEMPEMPDLENPAVGVLCAAPYSLDQQWYRAQVLDGDADITTVRFVDYGNTDVVDNHTTKIKTLPTNLLALEVYATRCRLKIKSADEEWSSAASDRFDELAHVDALTVQFLSQDEKTNYVELFSNGVNIREVMIQENLAVPDEEGTVDSSSVGFVSHLNSPSEFWIQLENCVDELEWVAEQLSGSENFAELEDLAPGTLCAALFPDDQMWYRARILSNTVAGIEVLFVDYGNSCTSCSLRELPEDLLMLAPLAQKCSLQKPEGLTVWGPEIARQFSEISAEGQTTFNVKKLSTGETASVELLLDGVDVTTLIMPKTEDVRVKSFEGLEQLVLVKGDEELPEKFKLESLPDVLWNDESEKKFAELNDNGSTVFGAEFVSEDTVRLYLGLNDIRLELSGTKTATPTSSPLKIRKEIPESDSTHSENAGEVKKLVESFVDEVIQHHDNCAFVGDLVSGVVNNATNQNDSLATVENVLQNLLNNVETNKDQNERLASVGDVLKNLMNDVISASNPVDENRVFVESLVNGVVDGVGTNQNIHSDHLIVGTNKIEAEENAPVESVESSPKSVRSQEDVTDDVETQEEIEVSPAISKVTEPCASTIEEKNELETQISEDTALENPQISDSISEEKRETTTPEPDISKGPQSCDSSIEEKIQESSNDSHKVTETCDSTIEEKKEVAAPETQISGDAASQISHSISEEKSETTILELDNSKKPGCDFSTEEKKEEETSFTEENKDEQISFIEENEVAGISFKAEEKSFTETKKEEETSSTEENKEEQISSIEETKDAGISFTSKKEEEIFSPEEKKDADISSKSEETVLIPENSSATSLKGVQDVNVEKVTAVVKEATGDRVEKSEEKEH